MKLDPRDPLRSSTSNIAAVRSSLLLCGLFGLAPAQGAQAWGQEKLLPAGGLAGDAFGSAVATDGTLVAVGAPLADDRGAASGSAYLFFARSGAQHLELVPADGAAGDQFGASVAVDGTRAVVGAPLADGIGADSGAAYVFDAITGLQMLKLEAADALAGDQFGYAVAMDGELIVVGSLTTAYVFHASTGQQLDELVPTGGSTTLGLSAFGEAVDIDAGVVVVGARLENGVSGISGAAYVFDAVSGDQLHRLIAVDGTAWAFFGATVGIDGDVIAVGAPEAGPMGKHSGAAYVFDADTGQQIHKLVPNDGHVFANFGSAVAVDGPHVVVGAEQDDGVAFSSGSAYVYGAEGGSFVTKLVASDGAASDDLGGAVASANGVLVAGAAGDDDNGDGSGSAYVFGAGTVGAPGKRSMRAFRSGVEDVMDPRGSE